MKFVGQGHVFRHKVMKFVGQGHVFRHKVIKFVEIVLEALSHAGLVDFCLTQGHENCY